MPTTFQEIQKFIKNYLADRDREPVSSGDIAKSLVIEAAELLEHYQWDEACSIKGKYNKPKDVPAIEKEVADLFIYLFQFCELNGINPADAITKKLKHLEEKYPIDKVGGENTHYWKIKEDYRKEGKN